MTQKPQYSQESFQHWKEIQVRYRDLDTLQHVNNAIFNTYFEESRIHFLHSYKRLGTELGLTRSFVLVHFQIDYIAQVKYPSTVLIGARLEKTGNTSVQTLQAAYDSESKELKATCTSVLVWYDIENQRPARLPELNVNTNG